MTSQGIDRYLLTGNYREIAYSMLAGSVVRPRHCFADLVVASRERFTGAAAHSNLV